MVLKVFELFFTSVMISLPFLPTYGRVICTMLSCIGSGSGFLVMLIVGITFSFSFCEISLLTRLITFVGGKLFTLVKVLLIYGQASSPEDSL